MHIDGIKPLLDTGNTVTMMKTEEGYVVQVQHPARTVTRKKRWPWFKTTTQQVPVIHQCIDKDGLNDAVVGLFQTVFTKDGQMR